MNELHKQNQYETAEGEGDTVDGEPLFPKQTWIYQKIHRIKIIASKASNKVALLTVRMLEQVNQEGDWVASR